MALSSLGATRRTDLADPGADRFSDEVLKRCILRSAFPVGRDTGTQMTVIGGEISPDPQGEVLEILLLQAQIAACQFMRAATANAFSFSSGDKRVDKTSQPEHWAKLESDLTATYRQRLHEIRPETGQGDYILTPRELRPIAYEQGIDLETTV